MKKTITLLLLSLITLTVTGQNVRFSEGTFDNGLVYPIAEKLPNEGDTEALNANILKIVSDYNDLDYCISQYGFVQHNNFIQMNFYFNCIDIDESITQLHLFDLSDGEICLPSEMIAEDQEKQFNRFFKEKISDHYTTHNVKAPENGYLSNLSINHCKVVFNKLGLEISLESRKDWPNEFLLITWSELGQYLKHLRTR